MGYRKLGTTGLRYEPGYAEGSSVTDALFSHEYSTPSFTIVFCAIYNLIWTSIQKEEQCSSMTCINIGNSLMVHMFEIVTN